MKTNIKNLFLLAALIAALGFTQVGRLMAQTFTTLHSFTGGSDGGNPNAGFILSGNTLYSTASHGGSSGNGAVFAINTDGSGFTNLHSFNGGSDGANPYGELVLSGNTLYGTAYAGGTAGAGTVFAVNRDGTGFTNLHSFNSGSDGASPVAGLILSSNTLYGTAYYGGSAGVGTVFAINTDGTGFTNLHSFTTNSEPFPFNALDGSHPNAGLLLSGNTLYGTTEKGGGKGAGTVFAVNTDGTGFAPLHRFAPGFFGDGGGGYPLAGLILSSNTLSGNTLYGTTFGEGNWGNGTVFRMNTDTAGFAIRHSFTATSGILASNTDGAFPVAGLIISGDTLYGMASEGGSFGYGTVFALNTDGTGFTNLHSFAVGSDGGYSGAGLLLSGNTLYGTAWLGGSSGKGTVFSLSLGPVSAPPVTITPSGGNVILSWLTNAAAFTLQSAPAITGTFTNISGATSPFTNPISGARQFFRLISN